jgi:hypothetical protein
VDVREVFEAINRIKADGVIDGYAVGGAVGATFYLDPVATYDVDIFAAFPRQEGQLLITLKPIFDYLRERGCAMDGEHVVIGGWPVQFLPPTGPLVEEALENAVETSVEGTPVRVFTAEHLAAIALQTGRAKDKARLLQFIEAGVLDLSRFQTIVERHGLGDHWKMFRRQFLGE